MGKLSSSKRDRRSNASSSARRRKSDGIKSRRTKSKKSSSRRRRHDSDSWSSESDYDRSLSPSSDSYSSSEDDYRRNRRSRSFSRNDGRKSKKRVRRNSHSFTSDEGSPPSKRRKKSKRKGGGSRSRRKSGRSRYGRDASVGYSSCSTCANRSDSEDEYESYRGRSERRESFIEVRDDRSRDRSGSCSSCRQCSRSSCGRDSMSRSEERATEENNLKRLRSVIVVVEERKGEENKEEIVYDKDDYPASRSNDGNDDESKKDALDTKGMFESGIGKEVVVSKLHGEPIGAGGNWQDGNQGNSRPSPGTNHEDLETMLRLRALQNLQKLQGIRKAATSHASQEPTVAAAEEPELPREDQVNATGATSRDSSGDLAEKIRIIMEKTVYARQGMVPTGKQSGSVPEGLVRRTVASIPGQEVLSAVAPAFSNPWRTLYTWRRESALSQPPAKQLISPQKPKPLQQKPLRTEISTTTSAAENPHTESALNQLPTKKLSSPQKPKQLQADPMVTETTNSASFSEMVRIESASNVPPAEELSVPEIPKPFLAKPTATEMAITASAVRSGRNGNASDQTSLNEVPHQSTDAKSAPGAGRSEKVMDDAKEDPQYEQKTMSVTRGGEPEAVFGKVKNEEKEGKHASQKIILTHHSKIFFHFFFFPFFFALSKHTVNAMDGTGMLWMEPWQGLGVKINEKLARV